MTVSEIVTRVKAAIDELEDTTAIDITSGNEDGDGTNLDNVITDKISYALEWIYMNAPLTLLDDSSQTIYTGKATVTEEDENVLKMTFGTDNIVTVELPTDILRIVSARLSSWTYAPVPVNQYSEEAKMQQYKITMGSPDMPAVVVLSDENPKKMKMYTADGTDDTLHVSLILKPTADTSDTTKSVSVPKKLEMAFIYHIAGLTLTALRDGAADAMFKIAMQSFTVNS